MSIHHRPVEVVGVEVLGQSTTSAFYIKRYSQVLCGCSRLWSAVVLRDIRRLQTLPALGHLVGYLLALLEGLKSAACYPRVVHERIFATIFWRDEAKALLGVEPLDGSLGQCTEDPAFLSLGFSARNGALLILPGSAPAASKPVATAFAIYSTEEERTGGSGEDTRPCDVPEFPRTL
jgi:hypothetical protein